MVLRHPPALDRIDIKILAALQADGRMTVRKLADLVGLSARPCLERLRRLEVAGVIAGYQAVIDVARLSRPITVFAEIALERHGLSRAFERRIRTIEELVECWQVSGTFDYLAKIVCADIVRYEAITGALIDDPGCGVARIVSQVGLRAVRRFDGYPVSLLTPNSSQS
jgi:DNA-binding Lrp family transcriptional regulator